MKKLITLILTSLLIFGLTGCIPEDKPEEYLCPPGYVCVTPDDVEHEVFLEVMQELMENHYTQPTQEELYIGAIEGMINSLGDPHTTYFSAAEYEQYRAGFGESYVGIGVTVSYIDSLVVVEQVKDGGPADQAGIRPNDIIAFVDGVDVRNSESFYEVVGNIIGDEGTEVTIGVIRAGVENVIYLTMTRAVIDNSSVEYTAFEQDGSRIGYIKVSTFGDETFTKFREAIIELEKDGVDSMIVDLRYNGGGHLSTVYNMMNQFLIDDGTPMFSTEYYSDGELLTNNYYANNSTRKDYNVLTLVNGGSASASEVFASGMQEQGGYPLLGTLTFGKGTMQTDRRLVSTEADSIHITIGKWLTSDGNWVHFNGGSDGITPDVVVEPTKYEQAYKLFLFDDETLNYDQVDPRIANMQLILNIMGYDVREDGYFDMNTKTAIMDIQTDNGLTSDGVVDNELLDILNTALDTYQDSYDNDSQLQAAIDYLLGN